jgi:hypothetical protein
MSQEECLSAQGGASLWTAIWGGIGCGIWGALVGIPGGPLGMIAGATAGAVDGFVYGLAVTGACETAALAGQQCPGSIYSH